jgi:hypothetical protein
VLGYAALHVLGNSDVSPAFRVEERINLIGVRHRDSSLEKRPSFTKKDGRFENWLRARI